MYYTREQHKRFLDKELQAISENYIRVLNTKATALLSENEVYVAQFMKVDLEKDANKLAAEILMPLNKIKELYFNNNYNTSKLAKEFNVSEQAIKIRVDNPYNSFLKEE